VPVPDYTDQMKMNKNLGAWLLRIAGIVLALFGVDYMLAAFHWPTLLSWLPPYDAGDLSIGLLSLVLACVGWFVAAWIISRPEPTYDYEGICKTRIEDWHRDMDGNAEEGSLTRMKQKIDLEIALAEFKIKSRQADHASVLTWLAPILPFLGAIFGGVIGGMVKPAPGGGKQPGG